MSSSHESPVAWVTGAAGFIGRHLCQRLCDLGWQVVALDNLSTPDASRGLEVLSSLPLQFAKLDLHPRAGQLSDFDDLPFPQYVFHLAAKPGVRSSTCLTDYLEANCKTTARLIQVCERRNIRRLIFASSSSVYGNLNRAASETDLCKPVSVYGESKLRCERLLQAACHPHFSVIALRLFSVYGPGQRPDMAFAQWIKAIKNQEPLHLHHTDPPMYRDFTFVDDAVQGFLKAAAYFEQTPESYHCFNIASGESLTLNTALQTLEQTLKGSAKVIRRKAHPAEVTQTRANLSHAQQTLGYTPRYNLRRGLQCTII